MRTVTYGAACSLDGFIAGRDGAVDWLQFSDDVQAEMTRFWQTVDTVLMGRKTWQVAVAMGGGPEMPGVRGYVFSRTLDPTAHAGVEIVSSEAGAFVRALKRKPGKGICVMGGGDLATSLLAAGVVDEVGVNIHPILLGSGVPLFRDPGRVVKLELKECRTLQGGCVLATYRVRRANMERAGTHTR